MTNQTSLFLSQSYKDAWDDYKRSLTRANFARWDYVIITASNDFQAKAFETQIKSRQTDGLLPKETHFAVIPDPEGKRVGSGGATLGVIRYIAEHCGSSDFDGLRILVIHSGGDSKRVPQYSALGKLFSPVPRELPNGRSSTLFDEFMIGMSSVPARIKSGMLLLSGDVLLLFNPLQIDYSGENAAAISFKEDVNTGKNHGVFLRGSDGYVAKFLHKQTVETLTEQGAVNDHNCVDIDTGAVIFSTDIVKALYSLLCKDNVLDEKLYNSFVNDTVRLSLYGDFLYPLATESTFEDFCKEAAEGNICPELLDARKYVWDAISGFKMKLLRLAPAKFIHFGTTKEILALMTKDIDTYKELDWSQTVNSSIAGEVSGYNSVLSQNAQIGDNCYLEVSYVHSGAHIGDNVLLSYVDIHNETIPSDVVIHGLKQIDGRFVARIYGISDNPKGKLEDGCTFLGESLNDFVSKNNLKIEDLWDTDDHSLWNAKLYPQCNNIKDAVASALNLYELAKGKGDLSAWLSCERKSLCSGFNDADSDAIIAWDNRMKELVCMEDVYKCICARRPVSEIVPLLAGKTLTKIQKEWLNKKLSQNDFSTNMRLHYYIGTALGGSEGDYHVGECFKCIQSTILEYTLKNLKENTECKIVTDEHTVKLPLRVNWGGGWSDTPPYCMENGGTVLNAAILLNGQRPVSVTLKKIDKPLVIFDSRDMDVHGEFDTIEPLQRTGDPYDPFALQKACLLACGVIPKAGGDLKQILKRLGGGFEMHSEVTNVPKGSGLGTSSILSATCVKAVFEFMGIEHTEDDLYSHVLCMEQIMSTGGGWQDQVGGITDGIKYLTSRPGINQNIKVTHIELDEKTKKELNERYVLIYTGQRRLARNLLRDVVGRYVGSDPDSLYALNEIQKVAVLMRFELERGNIDEFAHLLEYHWQLSKTIDAGSTNTVIDQIFASIEDLLDGKLICGAGGGGFIQAILKKGVSKETVHQRLKSVFADSDIDVWDTQLV